MGRWQDGIFIPNPDKRGEYIRVRMREKYPQIDDEFAVMWYGTTEEKAEHAAWRDAVKAEADRLYPKEGAANGGV